MTAFRGFTQAIQIIDNEKLFRISVPILKLWLRIVLFTPLALFWSLIFFVEGPKTGLLIVFALTSYAALLLGVNSSRLTLRDGVLITTLGPVPLPVARRKLDAAEVVSIGTNLVRAMAGRGGYYLRYAVVAYTRYGRKPTTILEGIERESDATAAARAVVERLNLTRTAGAGVVEFRGRDA